MDLPPGELPLTLSTSDVCSTLSKVNTQKAAGPDGVAGHMFRACAEQLAEVFTDIPICPWPRQLFLLVLRLPSPCQCTPLVGLIMTSILSHNLFCLEFGSSKVHLLFSTSTTHDSLHQKVCFHASVFMSIFN